MKIEEKLVKRLKRLNYKISFAESMTGGMLASTIVNVSGASDVIEKSYITYSNAAKNEILNVSFQTIEEKGIVSEEVAQEMVKGLYLKTYANVCVSITGYADGYLPNKGKFCYSIICNNNMFTDMNIVDGKRNSVRKYATEIILERIYSILEEN